jgi:hypothetical protein
MSKENIGSSFDDFLQEEGTFDEAESIALKRVITFKIQQAMKEKHISKKKMAQEMKTSRSYVDRFLDPTNTSVKLDTLERAAHVVGHRLVIDLEPVTA